MSLLEDQIEKSMPPPSEDPVKSEQIKIPKIKSKNLKLDIPEGNIISSEDLISLVNLRKQEYKK